jgi:DNA-binding transcriptional ArsR family regulator
MDAVFSALAHATRRHILQVLHARGGAMTAGALAARFSCAWPTTTRHLNVLAGAGLVRVSQEGRQRWYTLDRDRLLAVTGLWLSAFGPSEGE